MDALSRLDLVFCLDITASMTPFIDAARAQVLRILDELRTSIGDGPHAPPAAQAAHVSSWTPRTTRAWRRVS